MAGGPDTDVTFDLAIEEIVVLADAVGTAIPPPLGTDPIGLETADARAARLDTARRRALVARHLLDASTRAPVGAVASLFQLFAAPEVVVRVQREEGGILTETSLCATFAVAGELFELASGLWRFTVFDATELLARIAARAGLAERPHGEDDVVRIRPGAIPRVAELIVHDSEQAVSYLDTAERVQEAAARRLVDALRARVASAIVTILWRPEPTVLAGGELSWLDCADRGLWLLPVPELGPSEPHEYKPDPVTVFGDLRIDIEPVSARSILAELMSYLPDSASAIL